MSDEKLRKIESLHDAGKIDAGEAARQEKLQQAIELALKDFVGREMTPTLITEAEGSVRRALFEMAAAGIYKLPPNLTIDRVELGEDMRIKVYFKRVPAEHSLIIKPNGAN